LIDERAKAAIRWNEFQDKQKV